MFALPMLSDYYDCHNHVFVQAQYENKLRYALMEAGYYMRGEIDSILWDPIPMNLWHRHASSLCNDISTKVKDVIFSNEVIIKTVRGDKTCEQVLREIDGLMKDLQDTPFATHETTRRKLEDMRKYLQQPADKIREIESIRDLFGQYDREYNNDVCEWDPDEIMVSARERRIIRDIRRQSFSGPVLGSYRNGVITLYLRAICGYAKDNLVSPDTVFSRTFVHELFHLYHHHYTKLTGHTWNPARLSKKHAQIVKESCAEYVSWLYVKDSLQDVRMMNLMEQDCLLHDYEIWPYAGALYLEQNDRGQHEALRQVFKDSLCDWTEAYHDIVVYEHTPRIYP